LFGYVDKGAESDHGFSGMLGREKENLGPRGKIHDVTVTTRQDAVIIADWAQEIIWF
jgi:hypothetical protein